MARTNPSMFLVADGSLPNLLQALLGRSISVVQDGTALDVARFLLKVGGGSEAKQRIWQVTRLAPFEDDETEMLAEAVREGTAAGEEFAVRLEELRIPLDTLSEIA